MVVAGTQTVLKGDADQDYCYAAQEAFIKAATLEKRSNKHKAEKLIDLARFYLQLYKLNHPLNLGSSHTL